MTYKQAAIWSIFWVLTAVTFGAILYAGYIPGYEHGTRATEEATLAFYSGYILEKALSVDNLFVIALIFGYFNIADKDQRRFLNWGIAGAIVLRGALIFAGAALVSQFSWVLYGFGAFLVWTAYKLMFYKDEDDDTDLSDNKVIVYVKKLLPWASPSLIVIACIEISDLIFALDSIPAIFGITTDPFIIITSNLFAILGLRSLYFLVSNLLKSFHYLQQGLAVVLGFVGIKMLIVDFYHIPIAYSLGFIVGCLSVAVIASVVRSKRLAHAV